MARTPSSSSNSRDYQALICTPLGLTIVMEVDISQCRKPALPTCSSRTNSMEIWSSGDLSPSLIRVRTLSGSKTNSEDTWSLAVRTSCAESLAVTLM